MCGSILLGTIGVLAVSKVLWRVRGGGCHGAYGGGRWAHHGDGDTGPGWGGHRWRFRFGGRRQMRWLAKELELNERQREELKELIEEVRGELDALNLGRAPDLGPLVEAFGDEAFDRARVEQAAQAKGEQLAQAKKVIADAFERFHDILIPEQRRRLRDLLGRLAGRFERRDAGPYRTAL
jgi:Spy/CpxP family protein refolding chaperone